MYPAYNWSQLVHENKNNEWQYNICLHMYVMRLFPFSVSKFSFSFPLAYSFAWDVSRTFLLAKHREHLMPGFTFSSANIRPKKKLIIRTSHTRTHIRAHIKQCPEHRLRLAELSRIKSGMNAHSHKQPSIN